jgi:energy-coupling factor transporter ATP-binding protein EcfA2
LTPFGNSAIILLDMSENIQLVSDAELATQNHKWSNLANSAIKDCPKIKKEREIAILTDRFGIGKNAKTLHAIGLTYGVTRERIRQIVNNSLKKIQKNCISPELAKNIKLIESQVEKHGGIITKTALAESFGVFEKTEQNAVNFCASLSSSLVQLKESKDFKKSWTKKNVKPQSIKDVSKKALAVLKDKKVILSAKKIAEEVSETPEFVTAVLGSTKEAMKTDLGDWGLTAWPHVNPKSIRDKSKYIMTRHGKPMHYSELTDRISDIGTKNVTKQSVHNELIKNNEFVLVGRGIYALSEWGYEPGVVEEVIVEVLQEEGGPLPKDEIVRRVLEKRIVKESTIVLNLQRDRFKRVDKAVYTLN